MATDNNNAQVSPAPQNGGSDSPDTQQSQAAEQSGKKDTEDPAPDAAGGGDFKENTDGAKEPADEQQVEDPVPQHKVVLTLEDALYEFNHVSTEPLMCFKEGAESKLVNNQAEAEEYFNA